MGEDKGSLRLLEFTPLTARQDKEAKASALETLEDIRQLVADGVVVGVAVSCLKRDGGAVTAWSSECGARLVETLGTVQVLAVRLHERVQK
jgi:hypothetical protein